MDNNKYCFILYKYVGETNKEDFQSSFGYYDWHFFETDNTRKALYQFWEYDDCNDCYSKRKKHKQDYQIFDMKIFNKVEKEKFIDEYYKNEKYHAD